MMYYQRTIVKTAVSSAMLIHVCCAATSKTRTYGAAGYDDPYIVKGGDVDDKSSIPDQFPQMPPSSSSRESSAFASAGDSEGSTSPPNKKDPTPPPVLISALVEELDPQDDNPALPKIKDTLSGATKMFQQEQQYPKIEDRDPQNVTFLEKKQDYKKKPQQKSISGAQRARQRNSGKEHDRNLLGEAVIFNRQFKLQNNPILQTEAFTSLPEEKQQEILKKSEIHGWNHEQIVSLVTTLERKKVIIPDDRMFFITEDNETKWNYATLLRAFKLVNEHKNKKDRLGRIRYHIDLWANDYVLHKQKGNCCTLEKSFRFDYLDTLPSDHLKGEVYEYCRTGIISRDLTGKNGCPYDIDFLQMRSDSQLDVLEDVRISAFEKFIQNQTNMDVKWWLGLKPVKRRNWMLWIESSYQVRVMQYEVIRPEDERDTTIVGIGQTYEDHLIKVAHERAQKAAKEQREEDQRRSNHGEDCFQDCVLL